MSPYLYDAFISYRHLQLDKAVAKNLHTLIETYHIPASIRKRTGKQKMGKVFRDEEELPLSASLSDNIETALRGSQWLIVICTPALLESKWCMQEIDYFISLGRREKILVVLADGTPETSFPPQLRTRVVNGRTIDVEPLAAVVTAPDTRGSLKLLRREKLRILAPMLGVGFDDLRRRARQRKIRLTAAVASAVLVAGALFGTYYVTNRNRSEQLRRTAELQARIAEEGRQRAAEEQQKKEEEHRIAVNNELGQSLERASAALAKNEKIASAEILLGALSLSDENGGVRHDELIAALRRSMYIEPLTVVSSFNNQNIRVNDIVVSPDGSRAIGIVNGNSVVMIDLNANEILFEVSHDRAMITDPCFSQDGSCFLALCDYGRVVQVWRSEDGAPLYSYTSKQNKQYHIANVFFWKDADTLLVQDMEHFYLVGSDGSEKLFYTLGEQMDEYVPEKNLLSQLTGRTLEEMFTMLTDDYSGMEVLVSEDRSKVIVGGKDGSTATIILNDRGEKISLLKIAGRESCYMPGVFSERYTLSPDGRTLSCLSMIGLIVGWDTDSGRLLLIDALEDSGGNAFGRIVYTADSSRMAYTAGNVLYVAEARSNDIVLSASIDDTSIVPDLGFTSDGKYLLMTNQSLFIINAETWALELVENAEFGTQFNNVVPLKDRFLITRYDGSANIYSMASISSVQTLERFGEPLYEPETPNVQRKNLALKGEHRLSDGFMQTTSVADLTPRLFLSQEGDIAALAYADGVIELFDTDGDGSVTTMIGQLSSYIEALAMSGKTLVASDDAARLLFYDLETRSVRMILNLDTVYSGFAFDPEGELLLACCAGSRRIDVFEMESAELLFSLQATDDSFKRFAFTEDGAYAVGLTEGGKYVVGNLWRDEDALLAQARRLAGE